MFAAFVASGNPSGVRIIYSGGIADMNTAILRNAGVAGVLARSVAQRPNVVNSMQIAADRGLSIDEQREQRAHMDTVRIELTTDAGVTTVEGAVVLGKPRLLQVDGIYCEAPMDGHITYLRNEDTPGVIGFVGAVLGRHGVNSPRSPSAARKAAAMRWRCSRPISRSPRRLIRSFCKTKPLSWRGRSRSSRARQFLLNAIDSIA